MAGSTVGLALGVAARPGAGGAFVYSATNWRSAGAGGGDSEHDADRRGGDGDSGAEGDGD